MAARAALILSGAGCVLPSVSSGVAVLAGTLRLKYICPRGSIAAFAFGSRLSFFLCQEKRDGLRCLAFLFRGSRSPSCVLAVSVQLSAFVGSLRVWMFFYGDLDGLPGCGGRGTGLAARPLCVFAQPHWRCCAFRGEYAGAARPKPAPKSRMWKRHCRLSGLSSFDSRCGRVLRGGHSARAQRRQLALPTASTPPPFSIFSTRWHSAASR